MNNDNKMVFNIELDEQLKLKEKLNQPSEATISNIIFNTGDKEIDVDLEKLFVNLQKAMQKKHLANYGKGELENIYTTILARSENVDSKVLPPEAIICMFKAGTKLHLDHTLIKDERMTAEELEMKNRMTMLDAALSQGVQTEDLDEGLNEDSSPLNGDDSLFDNLTL
jgi:hypothetical protein